MGAAGDELVVAGDDGDTHLARQRLQHLGGPFRVGPREADDDPGHVVAAAQFRQVLELTEHVAAAERAVVDETRRSSTLEWARRWLATVWASLPVPTTMTGTDPSGARPIRPKVTTRASGTVTAATRHMARIFPTVTSWKLVRLVGDVAHDGVQEAADHQGVDDVAQVAEDAERDPAGRSLVQAVDGEHADEQRDDRQVEHGDRRRGGPSTSSDCSIQR